jgi:hypothetical protein
MQVFYSQIATHTQRICQQILITTPYSDRGPKLALAKTTTITFVRFFVDVVRVANSCSVLWRGGSVYL